MLLPAAPLAITVVFHSLVIIPSHYPPPPCTQLFCLHRPWQIDLCESILQHQWVHGDRTQCPVHTAQGGRREFIFCLLNTSSRPTSRKLILAVSVGRKKTIYTQISSSFWVQVFGLSLEGKLVCCKLGCWSTASQLQCTNFPCACSQYASKQLCSVAAFQRCTMWSFSYDVLKWAHRNLAHIYTVDMNPNSCVLSPTIIKPLRTHFRNGHVCHSCTQLGLSKNPPPISWSLWELIEQGDACSHPLWTWNIVYQF